MPKRNPSPGQIMGRKFHRDAVAGQDADVVLAHLAAQVAEDGVAVLQLDGRYESDRPPDINTRWMTARVVVVGMDFG
jgi:hypothetical protein